MHTLSVPTASKTITRHNFETQPNLVIWLSCKVSKMSYTVLLMITVVLITIVSGDLKSPSGSWLCD